LAKVAVNPKARFFVVPIFVVGTYDDHGSPNAAVVAWGGTTSFAPPRLAVYLRRTSASCRNILGRGAFTVSIPTVDFAPHVDVMGTRSGGDVDKFALTGLTAAPAKSVDAPYVAEFPIVAECRVVETRDTGRHVGFDAEVVGLFADEECVAPNGFPDFQRVRPLVFAPEDGLYHGLSRPVGTAFAMGDEALGSVRSPGGEMPSQPHVVPSGRLFRPSRAGKLNDEERLSILSEETLVRLLDLRGPESVVDLGSGTGFYTNRLAARTAGVVYAVEVQMEMLERHVTRGVPPNVRLVLADLRQLPLPEASVDRALSVYAYHEAPGAIGLERVARALKPGGRLVIVDWRRSHTAVEHGPPLEIRATWQEVVEALAPHFSAVEGQDLDKYLFVATGVK
jgi:flavin reductase (DIM6/NTAB) family NADH-FMN oxidoreductase RutF